MVQEPSPNPAAARTIDLLGSGETCTDGSIDRVRKALDALSPGQVVHVIAYTYEQQWTITRWAERCGHAIVRIESRDPVVHIWIRKE